MKAKSNIVLVDDPLSHAAVVEFLQMEGYPVQFLPGGAFLVRKLLLLLAADKCDLLLIDPIQVNSIQASVINIMMRGCSMIGYTDSDSYRGLALVDRVGKDLGFKELLTSIKRNTK